MKYNSTQNWARQEQVFHKDDTQMANKSQVSMDHVCNTSYLETEIGRIKV
jgi:hypothetical protein